MQYPVDGSWEDESLVFDARKDEWEWPKDDDFSSVKVKPSEDDEQVDEEDEESENVPATDDGSSAPMHPLGLTVKVSAVQLACHVCLPTLSTVSSMRMQYVCCVVAVGVACFLVDPEESDVSINTSHAMLPCSESILNRYCIVTLVGGIAETDKAAAELHVWVALRPRKPEVAAIIADSPVQSGI